MFWKVAHLRHSFADSAGMSLEEAFASLGDVFAVYPQGMSFAACLWWIVFAVVLGDVLASGFGDVVGPCFGGYLLGVSWDVFGGVFGMRMS